MRIKIGNTWHDASEVPVCIQFDDAALEYVKGMNEETSPNKRFAAVHSFEGLTHEMIRRWMRDEIDLPSTPEPGQ